MVLAQEANVIHRRPAPARDRDHVIELERGARRAAVPGVADEGAPAPIALPDRAPHRPREGARVRRRAAPAGARLGGRRELPALELADQGLERAANHLRDIPGGDLMAEELLGVAQ